MEHLLVEAKMWTFTPESTHFNAFALTTVQMANFALTHTKQIAVHTWPELYL
jgi:hypothetical protein